MWTYNSVTSSRTISGHHQWLGFEEISGFTHWRSHRNPGEFRWILVGVSLNERARGIWCLPLSPFITTQILDPTHLSMSSELDVSVKARIQGAWRAHREEVIVRSFWCCLKTRAETVRKFVSNAIHRISLFILLSKDDKGSVNIFHQAVARKEGHSWAAEFVTRETKKRLFK